MALLAKSKEQKEKHIVLLVKEKNRLHEQLDDLSNDDPVTRRRRVCDRKRRESDGLRRGSGGLVAHVP